MVGVVIGDQHALAKNRLSRPARDGRIEIGRRVFDQSPKGLEVGAEVF